LERNQRLIGFDDGMTDWSESSYPKKVKIYSVIIVMALLISVALLSVVLTLPSEIPEEIPERSEISYTSHAPIFISGNDGFLGLNTSTGISNGSGTAGDPYIIEGWEIDATGSSSAICIGNSTSYFRVDSCHIINAIDNGISLWSTQNGTLFNCTIDLDAVRIHNGIFIRNSTNIIIEGNLCQSCREGIYAEDSDNITIIGNICTDNYDDGIWTTYADYVTANDNICTDCSWGLYIDNFNKAEVNNNTCNNNGAGIGIENGIDYTIANNSCVDNSQGIYLLNSSNGLTIGNNCSRSQFGMWLDNSENNVLSDNIYLNNQYGVGLSSSDYIVMSNSTLLNNSDSGIWIISSMNATLSNNSFLMCGIELSGSLMYWNTHNIDTSNMANGKPIYYYRNQSTPLTVPSGAGQIILANCTNMKIIDQNLSSTSIGIQLGFCSNITLSDNNCSSNYYGIILGSSICNILINNTCSLNRYYGMELRQSSKNVLINNTLSNNLAGMSIFQSTSEVLRGNIFANDGIDLGGNNLSGWNTHDIDTSNMANGKPIYYYRNQSAPMTVPSGAGQIILANCTNMVVQNQNISNTSAGVSLGFCTRVNIINNAFHTNDWGGISLEHSNNITVSDNNCTGSYPGGHFISGAILLFFADNNLIFNNNCTDNSCGILSISSCNNTIAYNSFCSCDYGIFMWYSNSNLIWNNSFHSNYIQAYNTGTNNRWNSTSGFGNYWSDWTTPDADLDGIVDNPYNIDGSAGAKDYYPLTTPSPVPPVIPEFSEVIIPIVGLMVIALIFGRTRKKPRKGFESGLSPLD